MSTRTIELVRYQKEGELVQLIWEIDGLTYERVVFYSKIDTVEKVMAWLTAQLAKIPEPGVRTGNYTLTIDDTTGEITDISRSTKVDDLLTDIDARQARIELDLAALPAATTAETKNIIARQLNAETRILDGLAGIIRFLQRIA